MFHSFLFGIPKYFLTINKAEFDVLQVTLERFKNSMMTWLSFFIIVLSFPILLDSGDKFNVHKSFRRCAGRSLNVLCTFPAGIYLLKFNNRNTNTRTRCEICSKLTIKTPERRQWHRSGIFIVNFKYISHLVLVFLLLTLTM